MAARSLKDFPIIEKVGGPEGFAALCARQGIEVKPWFLPNWRVRRMIPYRYQVAILFEYGVYGVSPSDFRND